MRRLLKKEFSVLFSKFKERFPESQTPGWVLVLTTVLAVPMHLALLSVFNQLLGDYAFSTACVPPQKGGFLLFL